MSSTEFCSFDVAGLLNAASNLGVVSSATTIAACMLVGGIGDRKRDAKWRCQCEGVTSDLMANLLLFHRVYLEPDDTQRQIAMYRCGVDPKAYERAVSKRNEFERRHSTPQPVSPDDDERALFVAILHGYTPESFFRLSEGDQWVGITGHTCFMGAHSVFSGRQLDVGTIVAASTALNVGGVRLLNDVTLIEPHVASALGIHFPTT